MKIILHFKTYCQVNCLIWVIPEGGLFNKYRKIKNLGFRDAQSLLMIESDEELNQCHI